MKTKIFRYLKYVRQYCTNLFIFLFHPKVEKQVIPNGRLVLIRFRSNIYRRHISNFIFWLHHQGYEIHLKYGFLAIGSMGFFEKEALKLKNLKIVISPKSEYDLTFDDPFHWKAEQTILMNPDYFQKESTQSLHIPLGMQPYMYYKGYGEEFPPQNAMKNERKISILFSGNLQNELYSSDSLLKSFGILPRGTIAEIIKERLPQQMVRYPACMEDLMVQEQAGVLVFNDRNKVMIPQKSFLNYLSDCDFFLFTPGVTHPVCHNHFEAMEAGAIPLLQFPECFFPPLEHGVNCVVFKDADDLIEKIKDILNMDKQAIQAYRSNLIEYHSLHVKPSSVIEKILQLHSEGHLGKIFIGLD